MIAPLLYFIKYTNKKLFLIIFGVSFAILPEVSLFTAFFIGIFSELKFWKIIILLSFLVNIGGFYTVSDNFLSDTLVVFLPVFLFSFFKTIRFNYAFFGKPIILSIFFVTLLSIFLTNTYETKEIRFESINVESIKENNLFYLTAKDKVDSWGFFILGLYGSGEIIVQIDIRSQLQKEINIGLLHSDLPKIWKTNTCQIKRNWSTCQLTAKLDLRSNLTFGVGGWATWTSLAPPIEVRNPRVVVVKSPQWWEYFDLTQRLKGVSFNENAFAANVVVATLIGIILTRGYFLVILALSSGLFSIFLSGSRTALAAFMIGLMIFAVSKSRAYKLSPWFFVITVGLIAMFQIVTLRNTVTLIPMQSQPYLRSLNIADQDSARGRLEIWRLAVKSWLENPRTFLIGTGDLSSAMKVKFDARSSSYGLTKDSLTHAHNLWLQTAGESGLLGLCAMIWLWGWVILRAWRSRDAGALALLAAIFVINSVDYLFFYAPVHLAFWMAAAGLKPNAEQNLLENKKPALLT